MINFLAGAAAMLALMIFIIIPGLFRSFFDKFQNLK